MRRSSAVDPQMLASALIVVGLSFVALSRAAQPLLAERAPPAAPGGAGARRPLLGGQAARAFPRPRADQAGRLREGRPVDLNRATTADLEMLPRIGPRLAERIVAYRRRHGPFARLADLKGVRGIGSATLARLTPLVEVR